MDQKNTTWKKLKRFWGEPLFNKLHVLGMQFYRLKGVLVYRFYFKQFGKGSLIQNPLFILNPDCISIGDRVTIRAGARLEVLRSDRSKVPSLMIGDETSLEQNVHIVCHRHVRIGKGVSISGHCCIVDLTHPHEDVDDPRKIGARVKDEDSFVEIGDGTFIGYGAVVLPNVKIGTRAVIGANSVVARDIPDYSVAAGAPAVVLSRYDWSKRRWVRDISARKGLCQGEEHSTDECH